ncbi:MAG TPA: hypothetical protein VGN01_17480 [Acidobacteriaceae bacterium]|jgi:hypothetical protein
MRQRESAYNLFLFGNKRGITELGVAAHDLEGTDHEKIAALQTLIDADLKTANRYKTNGQVTWERYQGLSRMEHELDLFEEIFRKVNAPMHPLVVITPVIDGKPRVEAMMPLESRQMLDLNGSPIQRPGIMVDYLDAYATEKGFDLPRLLNDDYFLAIKLLFNNRHFVSCAKLLMSFIDTIGFIDVGDAGVNFILWLDAYADLTPLGITSKELWEFRNGLVHMSNLNSRAVASGKTAPLILSVGRSTKPLPTYPNGAKRFNLHDLIDAIGNAVSNWIASYNQNPEKWADGSL